MSLMETLQRDEINRLDAELMRLRDFNKVLIENCTFLLNIPLTHDLAMLDLECKRTKKEVEELRKLRDAVKHFLSLPNWENRGPEWKDIKDAISAIAIIIQDGEAGK